jgi:hypothetical protein
MQYLVKSISRVFEGKKLVGSARYLERTQEILTQSPLSVSSASDYVRAPPSLPVLGEEMRGFAISSDVEVRVYFPRLTDP